ncbi:multicopper oxidase family protein [Amycolatopsis arida]|uniref:multicopper oxidase family protein n=1 Tax=Amycolatopsis arida TaxID=587909 RepID=UPI001FB8A108|nr:multicopper oxidase family protein [Amycolatopsis arida]
MLPSTAPLPQPFTNPLAVPEVLSPYSTEGDTDFYEVTASVASARILPGLRTQIWGYNGTFPGPTIRSTRGRKVRVRYRNELPVPIVTHLHGGRTPPEFDGYPTDMILPAGGWSSPHEHPGARYDQVFEYHYPLDQRAATLWYHDHRMDFTGPAVWRGLAGMHLHSDEEEAALPLPSGDREIPLMIADRSFAEDGSLQYPSRDPQLRGERGVTEEFTEGVLGDVTLVNGTPWPYLEVAPVKYRFRLLNACNARRYLLSLDPAPDDGPFIQIGSEGGLLGKPVRQEKIAISPAERFDVVIDFSGFAPGTTVRMRNDAGEGAMADVMEFRVTGQAQDSPKIPERLSDFEQLDPNAAVRKRKFSFQGDRNDEGRMVWLVENHPFEVDYIHADPKIGDIEMWQFSGDVHHPIHIHEVMFQVIGLPEPEDLRPTDIGWKDTVDLAPGDVARVLVRFDGYPGKYVFHCHNLEHEDVAMMANYMLRP